MKSLREPECVAGTVQRIRGLSSDSPRQWGKMTIDQMVCHLTDGFQMATGKRLVAESSTLWTRTGMKCFALYLPLPWPKGVQTLPEVDAFQQGTPPSEFGQDVEHLDGDLRVFVDSANIGRCGRHPFFGALSPNQWLRWGYLHADHHLRQFDA